MNVALSALPRSAISILWANTVGRKFHVTSSFWIVVIFMNVSSGVWEEPEQELTPTVREQAKETEILFFISVRSVSSC
jgi:hypothetical protein